MNAARFIHQKNVQGQINIKNVRIFLSRGQCNVAWLLKYSPFVLQSIGYQLQYNVMLVNVATSCFISVKKQWQKYYIVFSGRES